MPQSLRSRGTRARAYTVASISSLSDIGDSTEWEKNALLSGEPIRYAICRMPVAYQFPAHPISLGEMPKSRCTATFAVQQDEFRLMVVDSTFSAASFCWELSNPTPRSASTTRSRAPCILFKYELRQGVRRRVVSLLLGWEPARLRIVKLTHDCISLQTWLYFQRLWLDRLTILLKIGQPLRTPLRAEYKGLVKAAINAKRRAHAPYSRFRVGAALLGTSGRVYTGCNIELSTYPLTICAERTAIFKAVSEGERNFRAIAVVSDDPEYTPPCGACRQVLIELAGNIDFLMVDGSQRVKSVPLKALLPLAFTHRNLERKRRGKK